MFKNALVLVFALAVLQWFCAADASAQVGSSCVGYVGYVCLPGVDQMTCAPQTPPSVFNCQGYQFTNVTCSIMTPWCAPPDAGPETCLACALAAAGFPISLASGNTYIEENDVKLPGLSSGLSLDRTWNSLWPATQTAFQIGLFGPNWRSTFEERVFVGADHYMKYGRSDGTFWSFGYDSGSTVYRVAAPANVTATLAQGTTNWTLTFQNGEQRLFDNTTGHLSAIIDRNGNTTTLSYDSISRLVTVTDPVSRQLNFNYGNGSSYLVTSVTSNVGVTVSYSYDSLGRLSQVTEPDGSTLSFQYDSNSFISAVVDSQGNILESHSYDGSGRGLTSSRANGVQAVTISYQ
jgi:YD repeat-containing protein